MTTRMVFDTVEKLKWARQSVQLSAESGEYPRKSCGSKIRGRGVQRQRWRISNREVGSGDSSGTPP